MNDEINKTLLAKKKSKLKNDLLRAQYNYKFTNKKQLYCRDYCIDKCLYYLPILNVYIMLKAYN